MDLLLSPEQFRVELVVQAIIQAHLIQLIDPLMEIMLLSQAVVTSI